MARRTPKQQAAWADGPRPRRPRPYTYHIRPEIDDRLTWLQCQFCDAALSRTLDRLIVEAARQHGYQASPDVQRGRGDS